MAEDLGLAKRKAPSAYIAEFSTAANTVVGVPTAMPVFVGYTQCAGDPSSGVGLYNKAVPVGSMAEFVQYFGGPAPALFAVLPMPATTLRATPSFVAAWTGDGGAVVPTGFLLRSATPTQFALYRSMQLFFANGGGGCYVVSVGSYWAGQMPVRPPIATPPGWSLGSIALGGLSPAVPGLLAGLAVAQAARGPSIVVVPEACRLNNPDYGILACAMLAQAGLLRDRIAVLDLPGCLGADTISSLHACQTALSVAIAPQIANASYGACYAPALNTSVVSVSEIVYTQIALAGDNRIVNDILTTQANGRYAGAMLSTIQCAIAAAFPTQKAKTNTAQYSGSTVPAAGSGGTAYPPAPSVPEDLARWQSALNTTLVSALPVLKQIAQVVADRMNVQPPSGAIAGIYAQSDAFHGVWSAPANIAVTQAVSPLYAMNDVEQAGFNVPANGQAIDIVRMQQNRGPVVWGARTLDGNDLDYRYIQVRRTVIYIEQSIENSLQQYTFATNDAATWGAVVGRISAFLTGLWQQGGLIGTKASDAFNVACGVGSTMTPQDILDGTMKVQVRLQLIHPAEYILLDFTQAIGS